MADFGVTPEGFVLKRLADIQQDMVTALSTVQDPLTGEYLTVDLADENDPLVQIVNAVSDSISVAWEQLQLSYNQFDPLKATGAGLSGVVQLNALVRQAGTYSTATIALTGTAGTAIPTGAQISNMDGTIVFTIPGVVLDGSGSAIATGTCTVKGPVLALAGTLVKILTPISGWSAVTNSTDATPGTYEETDSELRLRQRNSTASTANSVIGSIYGGLSNLPAVTFARAYQNITDLTDSRGIPPHSVGVVISGGADADIAQVLHEKMPAGVSTYGVTTEVILDEIGVSYPYSFSRPIPVQVYIDVSVRVVNTTTWPTDGADLVKAAMVAFALGGAATIGAVPAYDQDGYNPGQSVYASDMFLPIGTVPGIQILGVTVGTTASPVDDTVVIAWNEIASISSDDINVTVS